MLIIDVQNEFINVYSFSWDKALMKKTFFCWLHLVVKQYSNQDDHHLLFSPEAFFFHSAQMVYASEKQFTITDYKTLLHEKVSEMSAIYGIDYESIDTELSVWMESWNGTIKELLWKSWKITRTRHFQAMRPEIILQLRESYGQGIHSLTCSSRHSALTDYLWNLLHRDSFICLLLSNDKAELCTIRQWFADFFSYAPLWTHLLFEAAQEQWVQKYLYENNDMIPNEFVKKLLSEAILFYWSAIIQRVEPYLQSSIPIVICAWSFHSLFFSLAQELFQWKWVFMMPYTPKQVWFNNTVTALDDIAVTAYIKKFSTS